MEASAKNLLVVCEADGDRRHASALADRVLVEQIKWLDTDEPAVLDGVRRWRGYGDHEFLRWASIKDTKPERQELRRPRLHGRFTGSDLPDTMNARRAFYLAMAAADPISAVLVIRDSDGQEERRVGLNAARSVGPDRDDSTPWPFKVVVGVAVKSREAWLLAGFVPTTDAERDALKTASDAHGDPCVTAERFTPSAGKSIVVALLGADPSDHDRCWLQPELDLLRERGRASGLAAYLTELDSILVPVVR